MLLYLVIFLKILHRYFTFCFRFLATLSFLWIGHTVEWPMGSLKTVYEHKVYCVSTAGGRVTLLSHKENILEVKQLWCSKDQENSPSPRRDIGTGRPALRRGVGPRADESLWGRSENTAMAAGAKESWRAAGWSLTLTSSLILNDNEWIFFLYLSSYLFRTQGFELLQLYFNT